MKNHRTITKYDILSMLKQNEEDCILTEQMRMSRNESYNPCPNGWNRHDFYREVFSDEYIDGFLMSYPHGRVIKQAERSFHYRGENQIFKSSKATLYRKLNEIDDKENALVEEFVAYMRIADFLWLLLNFEHTQAFISLQLSLNDNLFGVDLLYEQLAQHYGFETTWLDLTSDFEVALFFACCKFNNKTQKWEPLTKNDFNKSQETKFGVIFRRASNHPNNFILSDSHSLEILPIGFQPFMRCHMQNSYVAKMNKSSCLQEEHSFETLKFRHNEKLCNFIYAKMEGGKKIYPSEGLIFVLDDIEAIKKKEVFTLETFEYALEEPQFKSYSKELLKQLIVNYGYKIINASNYIPKEKIELVNNQYVDFDIEKTYNMKLSTRLCFVPTEKEIK